ncbi:MAG TPA: hypothetical protein VNF68_00780 [Candidatus Baltobacteraceae bacterium]|nr:hypothetical protein [Candidatus Baltobacteraceae bacterium]
MRSLAFGFIAVTMWLFSVGTAHATTEFARRTLLSCGACHAVGIKLNDFGQAYKSNHYVLPALLPRGDVPVTLQAQAGYFSDGNTGLPKAIADKVIAMAGGQVGSHWTLDAQQYVVDGGGVGNLREAWAEYTTSWNARVPVDVRVGQQVLPLPTDPERFKLSEADYAIDDQVVGNNPFDLYGAMVGARLSIGKEIDGPSVSILAVSNHDQGSTILQTGTDWMFVGQEALGHATFEAYRYTGRRALGGDDVFWRQGFGANAYVGRFTLNTMIQTGNDSDPLGTGVAIFSSGGYVQGTYQVGRSTFAYAREDGVNDTAGNFGRDFVFGASTFVGRAFKIQLEDVVTHSPQTHNSLALIFGVGASTLHVGSSSY